MDAFLMGEQFLQGRKSGTIAIKDGSIFFSSEDFSLEWRLGSVQVERGGASNRLLMMRSALHPDLTLCTAEMGLLKLAQNSGAELHPSWALLKQKKRTGLYLALASLVLIFGAMWGLWLLKDPMVHVVARQIPASWEEKLSTTQIEAMKLGQGFFEDSSLVRDLRLLSEPILRAVKASGESRDYNYRFMIANDPRVNAFAMPGGIVVVNTGLIQKAERVEEIQGVLAHEIAHAEKQHGMRNVISSLGLFAVIGAFTGGADGLLAILAQQGGQLATLKFSRDFEREADQVGFQYLVSQNVDPHGMLTFFQKLLAEPKGKVVEVMENVDFMSTHPATTERIERLSALEKSVAQRKWQVSAVSLEQLKAKVKNLK